MSLQVCVERGGEGGGRKGGSCDLPLHAHSVYINKMSITHDIGIAGSTGECSQYACPAGTTSPDATSRCAAAPTSSVSDSTYIYTIIGVILGLLLLLLIILFFVVRRLK